MRRLLAAALMGGFFVSAPASAGMMLQCFEAEPISPESGWKIVFSGVTGNGDVIVIVANKAGEFETYLVRPNGAVCPMVAGEQFDFGDGLYKLPGQGA